MLPQSVEKKLRKLQMSKVEKLGKMQKINIKGNFYDIFDSFESIYNCNLRLIQKKFAFLFILYFLQISALHIT